MKEILDVLKKIEEQNRDLLKKIQLLQHDNRCMKKTIGVVYQKVNKLDSLCNDTNLDSHIKDVINSIKVEE